MSYTSGKKHKQGLDKVKKELDDTIKTKQTEEVFH